MPQAQASFAESYEKLQVLGEGAYGVAYLVSPRSAPRTRQVAKEIRVSHLTEKQKEGALAESKVLQMMKHSNIVAHIDTFMEGPRLYIVMEYADGGDLASKIKDAKDAGHDSGHFAYFEEHQIMFIFVQVALALQHIHSRNVLHRDLKPLNIFLTKRGVVKLGDFGIARVIENSIGAQTTIGTPHYLSPEMCNSEPYGTESDLWSLGVVTYELAALRVPFHGTSLPAVALQIIGADPEPLPEIYSPKLSDIVFGLLRKTPKDRPALAKLLGSSFVQKYIERNLSHTVDCGNGGLELLSHAPRPVKKGIQSEEVVIGGGGQHGSRAHSSASPQQQQPLESRNRPPRNRESDERERAFKAAAQAAQQREFLYNRQKAQETKMRAEQDLFSAAGSSAVSYAVAGVPSGPTAGFPAAGAPAGLRRQGSYVSAGGRPWEDAQSGFEYDEDRGERRKAEVKRQAQERRDEAEALRRRELDRAMREQAEERKRLRMKAMQDLGTSEGDAPGGDAGHDVTNWQGRQNNAGSPQRAEVDETEEHYGQHEQYREARVNDRKAAEQEHLDALERARRELFLERQRLREKFAAEVAVAQEDGEGGGVAGNGGGAVDSDASPDRGAAEHHPGSPARRPVAVSAESEPEAGEAHDRTIVTIVTGAGGGGGRGVDEAADDEDDDRKRVEIVIPFTDKVRPKPKLSSELRPKQRAQSHSGAEASDGGGGKVSASPGPGARITRSKTTTTVSRARASGDEEEEVAGRQSAKPPRMLSAARQAAGSPARWLLPKLAPAEEDSGASPVSVRRRDAPGSPETRGESDLCSLQDALAGALRASDLRRSASSFPDVADRRRAEPAPG